MAIVVGLCWFCPSQQGKDWTGRTARLKHCGLLHPGLKALDSGLAGTNPTPKLSTHQELASQKRRSRGPRACHLLPMRRLCQRRPKGCVVEGQQEAQRGRAAGLRSAQQVEEIGCEVQTPLQRGPRKSRGSAPRTPFEQAATCTRCVRSCLQFRGAPTPGPPPRHAPRVRPRRRLQRLGPDRLDAPLAAAQAGSCQQAEDEETAKGFGEWVASREAMRELRAGVDWPMGLVGGYKSSFAELSSQLTSTAWGQPSRSLSAQSKTVHRTPGWRRPGG
jgi:hypothetical protein